MDLWSTSLFLFLFFLPFVMVMWIHSIRTWIGRYYVSVQIVQEQQYAYISPGELALACPVRAVVCCVGISLTLAKHNTTHDTSRCAHILAALHAPRPNVHQSQLAYWPPRSPVQSSWPSNGVESSFPVPSRVVSSIRCPSPGLPVRVVCGASSHSCSLLHQAPAQAGVAAISTVLC